MAALRMVLKDGASRLFGVSPCRLQRRFGCSGFAATAEQPYLSMKMAPAMNYSVLGDVLQRFGISSSASPQTAEKETNQSSDDHISDKGHDTTSQASSQDLNEKGGKIDAKEGTEKTGSGPETSGSGSGKRKRRSTKRIEFSDSDAEGDLSVDDLVKLVVEKDELLKSKHKEIEKMQDKVLCSYAEMENVIDRTKREAENSKKFAIQSFAKSLLDVADNLGRASSVVKDSFAKIDPTKDSSGAVPLLKTLLEGVEMTDKQLNEVFRKFGVEKFESVNENFDPNRHNAVFQVPDASKPPGTVAVVLKAGYTLYDRIIRPAEVGVTAGAPDNEKESSKA